MSWILKLKPMPEHTKAQTISRLCQVVSSCKIIQASKFMVLLWLSIHLRRDQLSPTCKEDPSTAFLIKLLPTSLTYSLRPLIQKKLKDFQFHSMETMESSKLEKVTPTTIRSPMTRSFGNPSLWLSVKMENTLFVIWVSFTLQE